MEIIYTINGVSYMDSHMAKAAFHLHNMQFHRRVDNLKLPYVQYQTKRLYRLSDLMVAFTNDASKN